MCDVWDGTRSHLPQAHTSEALQTHDHASCTVHMMAKPSVFRTTPELPDRLYPGPDIPDESRKQPGHRSSSLSTMCSTVTSPLPLQT